MNRGRSDPTMTSSEVDEQRLACYLPATLTVEMMCCTYGRLQEPGFHQHVWPARLELGRAGTAGLWSIQDDQPRQRSLVGTLIASQGWEDLQSPVWRRRRLFTHGSLNFIGNKLSKLIAHTTTQTAVFSPSTPLHKLRYVTYYFPLSLNLYNKTLTPLPPLHCHAFTVWQNEVYRKWKLLAYVRSAK